MAYEQKEGQGSAFKNDKKGNEKAPDYTGTALIHGKLVKIAMWLKEGNGKEFYSIKIKDK